MILKICKKFCFSELKLFFAVACLPVQMRSTITQAHFWDFGNKAAFRVSENGFQVNPHFLL